MTRSTPAAQKSALKDALLTPTFLMCAPDFFDPLKEADVPPNDFIADPVDPALARAQWNAFKDKIEELGGKVILVAPQSNLAGQIYTADPAAFHSDITFTPDGQGIERVHFKSLRSKFTNLGRQGELTGHFHAAAEYTQSLRSAAGFGKTTIGVTHENASFNTEGSGDNVYDTYRGIWWSGYVPNPNDPKNGRSDIRAHAQLANLTDRPVLSLEVSKPYFHIDTSHTPLPRGHILSYEAGVTPEAYAQMKKSTLEAYNLPEDQYLIKVSKEDAELLACNLTPVNDTDLIVNSKISQKLQDDLEKAGYKTHRIDYSEALKGGGLFHCTANRINIIGPKGGTVSNPDFYNRIEAALA